MNILRAVRQKLRSKWQLAAASFLMITVGSFAGIVVGHKQFLHSERMGDKRDSNKGTQISRPGANEVNAHNPTDSIANDNESDVKKALLQKLEIDDSRLDKLEEERKHLPHALGSTRQSLPLVSQGSPAFDNIREQLSSALVNLLNLEKRENADNPKIIAVREQITRLQAQMARAAAASSGVRARPANRPSSDVQLDQINAEISLCGMEIISDLQLLAQAPSPNQETKPRNRAPKMSMNIGPATQS